MIMARKKKEEILEKSKEIELKSIGEYSKEAFLDYGDYINNHRHMVEVKDGCKISYRRLIYSATQFPKGKLNPTTNLVSNVSNYHGHNLDGLNGLLSVFVNSGVFKGEGSFGYIGIDGDETPPAANRYTKSGLSDLYWEIMGDLIKEVPYTESEVGAPEPEYLPIVFPLCLRWDTKIKLTDGRDITIKELTKEFESGKENYVLSCNLGGDFEVSKVISSCKTKTTGEYVKITLDNGEVINSTKEHLFMMRSGDYKKAEELQVGDSLMPGYIEEKEGRRAIKNNYSLNTPYIYRLSDLYNIHHGIYLKEKDNIHHIDNNKLNDNPNNLIRLTKKEHGLLHKDEFLKNTHSPEIIERRNNSLKAYWEDEVNHIKARRKWKEKGDIPDENGKTWREKAREIRISYNKSDLGRENVKNWWKTDAGKNTREKIKTVLKNRNQSEEMKQKVKDYWNSPEGIERKNNMKDQTRKLNDDPENTKKALRGKILTEFKEYIKDGVSREEAILKITSKHNFSKWFTDINDFLEAEKTYNHTIVSIELTNDIEEDFYDITVDSVYHNFLLSAGVVVHNCLYLKGLVSGLGVGLASLYPNFSPKSLYQAYIHNNPQLLEPNVDLIIDKKNSELERLWKTGKGRVIYSYKISRCKSDDGKSEGILFETKDGTGIFTPKFSKFKKLVEDGKVYTEDLTDFNGHKYFIGRVPGAKGITVDDIESIARKCCYDATTYQLNVTDGKTAFRIPLYDWIDYTYKNYVKLVSEVNQKKIEKCKFDILVLEALPYVSEYILNKNPKASDQEISQVLNIPPEVIEVVMSKPISYLRKNKDTADRVKALKDRLKELKKFDPIKYTEEIINKL